MKRELDRTLASDTAPPAMAATNVEAVPGLNDLWAESLGNPAICVAVLDGPVDLSHPSLRGAKLTVLPTADQQAAGAEAAAHATHVVSVIFGQHDSPVRGVAPGCRGLVVPIFAPDTAGGLRPCSQSELARAIVQAVEHGANVINISAGEFTPSGAADPILSDAVKRCAEKGVLIVAAAGNDGCECLHIPGAMPSVLAVGAADTRGRPLEFSNWGVAYQTQGIVAIGQNILGASPGGGTVTATGTSAATAIVSGVAALLLSIQVERGRKPDGHAVRSAILTSALGCDHEPVPDCRRLLAGRLNVGGAMSLVVEGGPTMIETSESRDNLPERGESGVDLGRRATYPGVRAASCDAAATEVAVAPAPPHTTPQASAEPAAVEPAAVSASACACGGSCGTPQLAYVIGQVGCDFGTVARRDSLLADMAPSVRGTPEPFSQRHLVAAIRGAREGRGRAAPGKSHLAAALTWTLNFEATPVYAVQPQGAFASDVYQILSDCFAEQLPQIEGGQEAERVAVGGYVVGQRALLSGQVVPVIVPDIRTIENWNTLALADEVRKALRIRQDQADEIGHVLDRIYHEFQNLGTSPQDRARNYAATNALMPGRAIAVEYKKGYRLEGVDVERSQVQRPGSDCWDVKFIFFNPKKRLEEAKTVYRFCVDVSDVKPVLIGRERCWQVH